MQVQQRAGPIPMGQKGGLGPRAMLGGGAKGTDYFLGPGIPVLNWQMVVELHEYVSRASLIKCEPTLSNSRFLQVSK